jgi:TPR repeat protein
MTFLTMAFYSDGRELVAHVRKSGSASLSTLSASLHNDAERFAANDLAQSKEAAPLSYLDPTVSLEQISTDTVAPLDVPLNEDVSSANRRVLPSVVGQSPIVDGRMMPSDADYQLRLDPDEIASLFGRGLDLIASGDVAAARLLLRRAANAGDAKAALKLASTYDPATLKKLGIHGLVPDESLARIWYEKAVRLGSAEATQRIELLASKQQ